MTTNLQAAKETVFHQMMDILDGTNMPNAYAVLAATKLSEYRQTEVEALRSENQMLRAAVRDLAAHLEIYSDPKEWSHKDFHLSPWALLFNSTDIDADGYETAKYALEKHAAIIESCKEK